MKVNELRKTFLKYFADKGHVIIPSSSLIPENDHSLLFTNSGMVQFKNFFLGITKPVYTRAASYQKCIRTGGKHNDLENVGFTKRHHTFFEMLGNFSFGDYFKKESLLWGWDFLTKILQLPKEKLLVTVYQNDNETFDIWHKIIGISSDRIIKLGMESNYWMMGDTGPCGPCSEILYDQGLYSGCKKDSCNINCQCDRYVEIWNHVFTQFNCDQYGKLTLLPKPNIDTGMGLERLASILQGVKSNYDIDIFLPVIRYIEKLTNLNYGINHKNDIYIRIIADHIRSATFLISDGILPNNDGRGYILRRILRRAIRYGHLLGLKKAFLNKIVPTVIYTMKEAYSELVTKEVYIRKIISNEEIRFTETLDIGLKLLDEEMIRIKKCGENIISGKIAFKLYDTFGFPVDLTIDILKDKNFSVDLNEFQKEVNIHRNKAKKSWKKNNQQHFISNKYEILLKKKITTEFVGYTNISFKSNIIAILQEGKIVNSLFTTDNIVEIFVTKTPFYSESGGQIGDIGIIQKFDNNKNCIFEVFDTKEPFKNIISHTGKLHSGTINIGDEVLLMVNAKNRFAIESNHTATHLLNSALKIVLGNHIKQAGSIVQAKNLRFDFTHFSKIEEKEIEKIENIVNSEIQKNNLIIIKEFISNNKKANDIFDLEILNKQYEGAVRIIKINNFSKEFCKGTHVKQTGNIGLFKITNEQSIGSGTHRIEAVTGYTALNYINKQLKEQQKITTLLNCSFNEITTKIQHLILYQENLKKENEQLKLIAIKNNLNTILKNIRKINGINILTFLIPDDNTTYYDSKMLRLLGDKIRNQIKSGILLLATKISKEKNLLLCMVTQDLIYKYQANKLLKKVIPIINGNGGGNNLIAQAGGTKSDNIQKVFNQFYLLF